MWEKRGKALTFYDLRPFPWGRWRGKRYRNALHFFFPLENIVVRIRSTGLALRTPCFLPCRTPFIRPRRRSRSFPPPSHSRLSSPRRFAYTRLATLLALGGFTSQKTILNRFLLVTRASVARVQIFLPDFCQQKRTPIGVLFVALNVIKGVWTEVKTNKRSTIILVLGLIKIDM